MKFKAETKTLSNVVSNVSKAIDKFSALPVLSNFKIKAKNDFITITGSNATSTIQQTFCADGGIEEDGECLVESKYFGEIIQNIASTLSAFAKTSIECTDNLMLIRCENAEFKLACTSISEYPDIDLDIPKNQLFCPIETFRVALKKALAFTAINDKNRPVLNGVNLRVESGKVSIVGTDSYKMNQYTFVDNDCKDANVTIPREACLNFIRMFGNDVKVYYDTNKVVFVSDGILYRSQLLQGKFPDVSRTIPKGNNYFIRINRVELLQSIKRCDFVKNDGKQIVCLEFDNECRITSRSSEIGETEEYLDCENISSNKIKFNLDGKFLKEALEILDSAEVMIETPGFGKPLIIKEPENRKFICLLVPVRTY